MSETVGPPRPARRETGLAGCVLLALASQPNARHRAEIQKLLVHRSAQRQSIGSALMARAEEVALGLGRWLLILDTWTGGTAEGFYRRRGWQVAGVIPLFAVAEGGGPRPTTLLWKDLRPPAARVAASPEGTTP